MLVLLERRRMPAGETHLRPRQPLPAVIDPVDVGGERDQPVHHRRRYSERAPQLCPRHQAQPMSS
jgi:hypothetical protein